MWFVSHIFPYFVLYAALRKMMNSCRGNTINVCLCILITFIKPECICRYTVHVNHPTLSSSCYVAIVMQNKKTASNKIQNEKLQNSDCRPTNVQVTWQIMNYYNLRNLASLILYSYLLCLQYNKDALHQNIIKKIILTKDCSTII